MFINIYSFNAQRKTRKIFAARSLTTTHRINFGNISSLQKQITVQGICSAVETAEQRWSGQAIKTESTSRLYCANMYSFRQTVTHARRGPRAAAAATKKKANAHINSDWDACVCAVHNQKCRNQHEIQVHKFSYLHVGWDARATCVDTRRQSWMRSIECDAFSRTHSESTFQGNFSDKNYFTNN